MKLHFPFDALARLQSSRRLLTGGLLVGWAITALAQQIDKPGGFTLKVNTTLVNVPVIVSDQQGRYVSGLKASDFALYENGAKQQIDLFEVVEAPFNVALLLDTSFSARDVIEDIKQEARTFIKQLRPQDRAMIVTFDWQVKTLSPLTGDHKALENAIKKANVAGQLGTVMRAAVDRVIREDFKSLEGRKAIVLLTDGKDAGSRIPERRMLEMAAESNTLIYSIFYTTGLPSKSATRANRRGVLIQNPEQQEQRDEREKVVKARNQEAIDFLERLAEASAGRYYLSDVTDLKKTFGNIADELRHQYWLGFYPRDHPAGSTYTLRVEVGRPGLSVRSRSHYRVADQR